KFIGFIYYLITVVVLQAFALHYRYKTQGNFLHFCIAESAFLCYNKFVKKIWGNPVKLRVSHQFFFGHERQKSRSRKWAGFLLLTSYLFTLTSK
ncbi:MAG: hypothetical protein IJB36_00005, partial [Clostridia bacterium]|nr:hypothetical protein [Clostridia bacterium]